MLLRKEVWAGPLSDGSVAVVLFNPGRIGTKISFTFSQVGLSSMNANIRDLINQKDLGNWTNGFEAKVLSHGCVFVRIYPIQ